MNVHAASATILHGNGTLKLLFSQMTNGIAPKERALYNKLYKLSTINA
jgi:hypothetical protein